MAEGITLARWSNLLIEEVFRDREGEGRPVSVIGASGALLARALSRTGVHVGEDKALELFLAAFPERWRMLRWFSGVENPGDATVAFLTLCCVVASESTGSDANDYRERFRELVGWDAVAMDCAALPELWIGLQKLLAAAPPDRRLRRLILPNPRFRTQIGHAIELTFPSRQDGRRLKRDLDAGGLFDIRHPVAVMRWVAAHLSRYSPTFNETFTDFQLAWRSGARALTDHRFWSGWRLVIDSWRPILSQEAFHIISDEWARYQFVAPTGEATTLRRIELTAPAGLRQLIAGGLPVLLREIDWGRWTWCGQGRPAMRDARAALIREKSHSATLLTQLDRAEVRDAAGWLLTTAVDLLPGTAGRFCISGDDLIDVRLEGVPRIDGGRLARPSFPIRLSTTGPVEGVEVRGSAAAHLDLQRVGPQDWLLIPNQPIDGDATVTIRSEGEETDRVVALRGSAIAPIWERELPKRFMVDERSTPWFPTSESEAIDARFAASEINPRVAANQGVRDLVEFLAARTGALPLGGFLELVSSLPGVKSVGPWAVLRALLEGGMIEPLRVRGWRGSAVMARPPRGVLVPCHDLWRMEMDGIVNEILTSRIIGVAVRMRLDTRVTAGVGDWSPFSLSIRGDRDALIGLAIEVEVGYEFISADLRGHVPMAGAPNADGATHGSREKLHGPPADTLAERGVGLFLCRRDLDDAPPVWLVDKATAKPRFWSHRHLAFLDGCFAAGIAPFALNDGMLRANLPAVHLPLAVARWLRLTAGVSAGPRDGGYAYAVSAGAEPMIRQFLSLERVAARPSSQTVAPRRPRGRGLATGRGAGIDVTQVWRWARANREGIR